MEPALVLIDIQNDYFPGGRMELEGSQEAGIQAGRLLSLFREREWPVFHIQHIANEPDATFFLPATRGVLIHKSVQPSNEETVIQKHHPNGFLETSLLDRLREIGIRRIVFCGMMTHMCVDATVRAACDLGFSCIVAHDACATKPLHLLGRTVPAGEVQVSFLAALNGVYAKVSGTDEIIAEMRKEF